MPKDMKIVTASDATFRPVFELTRKANLRWNMPMDVYDVGGLGEGIPCPIFHAPTHERERIRGRCPWKPQALFMSLEKAVDPLVWLDADAWIIRDISSLPQDYDVAVTMRRMSDRGRSNWPDVYGYLQAGVVFLAPTNSAIQFVKEWIVEVLKTPSQSDQHALNNLVRQATDLSQYNKVYNLRGCRIRVLEGEEYNWCYLPQEPRPDTKILHCKTDLRAHVDLKAWTQRTWI